jgi:hypothetical protein
VSCTGGKSIGQKKSSVNAKTSPTGWLIVFSGAPSINRVGLVGEKSILWDRVLSTGRLFLKDTFLTEGGTTSRGASSFTPSIHHVLV